MLGTTCLNAQWNKTQGLNGGSIQCLVVKGNTVLAGTSYRGIYRSTDNGRTWQRPTTQPSGPMVFGLLADGDNIIASTNGRGLSRSIDDGETWSAIGMNELGADLALPIHRHKGALYAGSRTGKGMFKSTDGGDSWSAVNNGILPVNGRVPGVFTIASNDSGLYIACGRSLYRSKDDAATWSKLAEGGTNIYQLALDGSNIYGGTFGGGLVRSTDDGATWSVVAGGWTTNNIAGLAVIGDNIYVGASAYGQLYVSTDHGATWSRRVTGMKSPIAQAFAIDDDEVFVGTGGEGVYRSTNNGADWTASSDGLDNPSISSLASLDGNVFAATKNGAFRSPAATPQWTEITVREGSMPFTISAVGGSLYAGGLAGQLDRSTDGGATWVAASGLGTSLVSRVVTVGDTLFAGGGMMHMSVDNGATWSALPGVSASSYDLYKHERSLFAIETTNELRRSTDMGATWKTISAPVVGFLYTIASGNGKLYLSIDGSVYSSTNNGDTWGLIYSGNNNNTVLAMTVVGDALYIAVCNEGVYRTGNDGTSWTIMGQDLAGFDLDFLTAVGDALFVSVRGVGVWWTTLPTSGADDRYEREVAHGALVAHPNPARDNIVLSFTLASTSTIDIDLVDALGRSAGTLLSGEARDAGRHSISVNTSGVATGLYKCRVRTQSGDMHTSVVVAR